MHYGTGSVAVVHGLATAFAFVDRIGIERIARWDAMLTKRLRDGLATIKTVHMSTPSDPRFASAITTFNVIGKTGVRLSAHLYVSPADIDRLLEVTAGVR